MFENQGKWGILGDGEEWAFEKRGFGMYLARGISRGRRTAKQERSGERVSQSRRNNERYFGKKR